MILKFYDFWPLWVTYLFIISLLFFAAEIGFYSGKARKIKVVDTEAEDKQTGSIMAASLGLLALLLAFSFNTSTNIHTERKNLVLKEANAIGTLYLRTRLFDLEQAHELREILREYITLRINMVRDHSNASLKEKIERSEVLHDRIWTLVTEISQDMDKTVGTIQLIHAANEVIDLHSERINAGLKRIPVVSSFILLFIALLTLALMGYQSGLNGARVLIPRTALILSLATVMIVIVDLDRPGGDLVEISQHSIESLQEQLQ
jgi:hypothetical protein